MASSSESGIVTFDAVIRKRTVNAVIEAKLTGINCMLQMGALGKGNEPRIRNYDGKWRHG